MRHGLQVMVRSASLVAALAVAVSSCGGDTEAGTFNDCASAQFVDRTATGAARTIGYGGASGSALFTYSPRCITIAAGQTVTFTGGANSSFNVHPLAPGVPDSPRAGSANNPIPSLSDGNVRDVTVTFPTAGTYPYVCTLHGPTGMTGVVQVR